MKFSTAIDGPGANAKENRIIQGTAVLFVGVWISTLIGTNDLNNWLIENTLVVIFLAGLILSYKKFRFSDLSYVIIGLYLCLHVYGSKYTYSENPLGYKLKELLNWDRNHYDRIVHFSFGLMLTYPMRDYFRNWFGWPAWVCWVLPCEITLSFSGMYEIIEWAVADLFFPSQGDAYLGTQGDTWDAQKDMSLAFIGAILGMIFTAIFERLSAKTH
jgi:putative membrane protein